MNPKAGETPEKPIGAHSDGNLGIRCAGAAAKMDRDSDGSAVPISQDLLCTSVAGGNSVPSDRGKTCDSADRRSPDINTQAVSRDESNPLCIHEFAVVKSIRPYTWRMKCELCEGLFDLMIVRTSSEIGAVQS